MQKEVNAADVDVGIAQLLKYRGQERRLEIAKAAFVTPNQRSCIAKTF